MANVWRGQEARRTQSIKQYTDAIETVQRLDPIIIEADRQNFEQINKILTDVLSLVNSSMQKYFGTTNPDPWSYDDTISLEKVLISLANHLVTVSGDSSWNTISSSGHVIGSLDVYIRSIKSSMDEDGPLLLAPLFGYLNGSVKTKSELYQLIYDQRYEHRVLEFHKQMSYLDTNDINQGIAQTETETLQHILAAYNLPTPIITSAFLQNLTLFSLIEDHYGRRGDVGTLLDTVKGEITPTAINMEKLIKEVLGLFKEDAIETVNTFAGLEWNFTKALNVIKRSLNQFEDLGSKIMSV